MSDLSEMIAGSPGGERRASMSAAKRIDATAVCGAVVLALLLSVTHPAHAQAPAAHPTMAPIEQYRLASPQAEIAMARSAAPPAISNDAEILMMGEHGYETAVKGKNGFVCLVERPWNKDFNDPGFWDPMGRAPTCYNPAGARSVLPTYLKRTLWVLAGASEDEVARRTKAAIAAREITAPEIGAMSYMMSKDQHMGGAPGDHWHPHLMFYLPPMAPAEWGADIPGAAVFSDIAGLEPVTVFFVPVRKWSDGTPGPGMQAMPNM
jgi:hypothetical protein